MQRAARHLHLAAPERHREADFLRAAREEEIYVAVDDGGRILGLAALSGRRTSCIRSMSTERGRGIGKALLDHVAADADGAAVAEGARRPTPAPRPSTPARASPRPSAAATGLGRRLAPAGARSAVKLNLPRPSGGGDQSMRGERRLMIDRAPSGGAGSPSSTIRRLLPPRGLRTPACMQTSLDPALLMRAAARTRRRGLPAAIVTGAWTPLGPPGPMASGFDHALVAGDTRHARISSPPPPSRAAAPPTLVAPTERSAGHLAPGRLSGARPLPALVDRPGLLSPSCGRRR